MTSPVARTVRRHPPVTFLALAFGIAWAFVPFGSFCAFGPLVAALVVIPIVAGRAGPRELGALRRPPAPEPAAHRAGTTAQTPERTRA